uniref:G_PROTEIN_RECEP_F3_4 domain-containing protein n=1 Tax=Bursaphelenchus xylophilus TaxID=6326 RepID=A0A1I7S5C9_BURXY
MPYFYHTEKNFYKDILGILSLYVGDSCRRTKESLLQTLRFLDSVDYYDPDECVKTKNPGKMLGVVLPKERELAVSTSRVLESSKLLAGAFSVESAEAVKGSEIATIVTSPMLEDYVMALTELMDQLESDLLVFVTCQVQDDRVKEISRLLAQNQIHISEIIHTEHLFFNEVMNATDAKIMLYLPCQKMDSPKLQYLNAKPKTIITLALDDHSRTFPFVVKDAKEIIIRQARTEIPHFRDYFLRLLVNNHESYALAASYIHQLLNCSAEKKDCPEVTTEILGTRFDQGPQVDAVVRLAYAFSVAGRFIESDEKLKAKCAENTEACSFGVLERLTSVRFVKEERGPLELAGEEMGFFVKNGHIVQSIGLKLVVQVEGGEDLFTFQIGAQPKVNQHNTVASLRLPRSVCLPQFPYCGQCGRPVEMDPRTTFINGQKVLPFYLSGVFNLHGENCEEIRQDSVVLALAYTYTLNTMDVKYPALALKPMRDFGALVVDSCSDAYKVRGFTVDSETQCQRLAVNDYNVTIPTGTILGQISALGDEIAQSEHNALLRGLRIPAISMSSEKQESDGILNLLPSLTLQARAVAEFLRAQHWEYISVVVSSGHAKQRKTFEKFAAIAEEFGLCIGSVTYIAAHNRTASNLRGNTNVTVFFTTALDAAEYVSARLRFSYDVNNVDIMVGEAGDFYLADPVSAVQYTGTVAIRPKDILPKDFVEYLKQVTPLHLAEPWFWDYVEKRWHCALNLNNRDQYEGRMCTGDELTNIVELGRMIEAGYLIRGLERFVLALNEAFRRVCGNSATEYCPEFMEKSREMVRKLLDTEKPMAEFEVDEFMPLDHHGNLGYRRIGNYTADLIYKPINDYKLYISGILRSDTIYTSLCTAPSCSCKRMVAASRLGPLERVSGSIKWFHANNVNFFANWDNSTLNYIFLVITVILMVITVLILLLIVYKVYSRVIKGNQSLGMCSLTGIIILNLTALLYIIDSKNSLLELRILLNSLAHVVCFGVILTKAICLRNAEDLCGKHRQQIGIWNYWVTLLFIIGVQLAVYAKNIELPNHNDLYNSIYILFLAIFALFINIRNRKIRRNYKESKWLFIANLVALTLFVSWIVARHVIPTNLHRELDIVELNSMALILLGLMFGTKVYILLFYEPLVVERCVTPMKPDFYDGDLFEKDMSLAASLHSIPNQLHSQADTVTIQPGTSQDDEFPVLKTVMRKKEFGHGRSSRSSMDRFSNASTSSN